MILKDNDKVILDDVEFIVTEAPPDGYWLKKSSNGSYFYMLYKSKKELEELYKMGRLVVGKLEKVQNGDRICSWHNWEKYVGISEVYDYCKNCNAKKFRNWRDIVDDKKY